ncbi:MAG TPA: response regulator [Clostridia bacterium]|nr:response regulator [Clostridia bacterium]
MLIKVLIVDDIAETRNNVRLLLSFDEEIVVVGEAGNGLAALEEVRKLKPDVVLMDINMPVMDGMTACQKIAALYPFARVIMMTVQGGREYIRKAYQMGAKGYIVKPFSSEELINVIKSTYLAYEEKLAVPLP